MTVVVMPWRDTGCPHRQASRTWVHARFAEMHPTWPIIEAAGPDGPFSRAAAILEAVEETIGRDAVVVSDTDVWCDDLTDAVEAVHRGASWAVPHGDVCRLDEDATAAVIAAPDARQDGERITLAEAPYRGHPFGGVVVLRRDMFDLVPDPRFVGWGQEDDSAAVALETLVGPPWRGTAPLWHLWHPAPERDDRIVGNATGWSLHLRYCAASSDPVAMRALIEEGRRVRASAHA